MGLGHARDTDRRSRGSGPDAKRSVPGGLLVEQVGGEHAHLVGAAARLLKPSGTKWAWIGCSVNGDERAARRHAPRDSAEDASDPRLAGLVGLLFGLPSHIRPRGPG